MFDPNPNLFDAEVRPAMDELRPTIGPNLAANEELAKDVASYISTEFFYPYYLQQQRYYPVWQKIDNMWRGTVYQSDIDAGIVQKQSGAMDNQAQAGGFGMANTSQTWAAKVSPAAAHKQIDAITNLGCAMAFEDGDLPVQARKPRTVYENPAYNPVEQSERAANEEMKRQAAEINLRNKYRIGFGNFVKYGHSFALRDFTRQLETIECRHVLPPNPQMVNGALMQLRNYYRHPEQGYEVDAYGRQIVVFLKTVPKIVQTNYIPLDVSSTFIDDLMPCTPMERQPCPIVKLLINRWELQDNDYDPVANPFGWVNVDKALDDNTHQYVLSQPEEQELRTRLLKRWGMNSLPGSQRPENSIQSLWTAYAMLAIDPATGKLDRGKGVQCDQCDATGKIQPQPGAMDEQGNPAQAQPCPACNNGIKRIKAQRYVVQMFGSLYGGGGVTVLRIQRNPTAKDKVPILFAAHLVEDTATARPVSKSEIALSAYEQLATGHNQFLDAKSRTISRGWFKRIGSLAYNINCNQPNVNIPFESNIENEVKRVDSNNFDETATLIPYIQMEEREVQDVFGVSPTVLGEISAGRRPSSEITLADEASKRPLIQQIDQFNQGHMGGWGQALLDDIEAWSDRDEMIARTGSPTWGKLELFTAVGEELLTSQAAIGQYRYLLEALGPNPQFASLMPKILGNLFDAMRLDISLDDLDQGQRKAQQTAFQILTDILGDGIPVMPNPDDPDEIYLGVFKGAYDEITLAMQTGKPNHWVQSAPQNIPLLAQRIQMQEMQLQQKQQAQMQQQLQMMALQAQAEAAGKPDPRGNQPKRPPKPAATPGQMTQQAQGANAQ